METKILTPIGCIVLKDERMAENAKLMFQNTFGRKDIEERTLMETKAKSHYKVETPFGCAYLRSYDGVSSEKITIWNSFGVNHEKDIRIVNAF